MSLEDTHDQGLISNADAARVATGEVIQILNHTLKHPVEIHGEMVSELTLKRPHVKHLKAIDKAGGENEKLALLIGELAGLPRSAVDQLDAEDVAAIDEASRGFFGVLQLMGATS